VLSRATLMQSNCKRAVLANLALIAAGLLWAPAVRAQATPAAPPLLVPPKVLDSAPPIYPQAHLAHGEHPTVVLKVTVLATGEPADVAVEHSAGPDFDEAAVQAVRKWRFDPARRGESPIASRVGVAVHFELPELSVVDVVAVPSAEEAVPHPHDEPHPDMTGTPGASFGARAVVDAELRSEGRGSSDFRLDSKVLHAAPRADAADLLKTAPGMVAARIEGDAVAHRLMLRGFDADHGQDIALSIDGLPINQVSHIHGQGYADLGFLIPEVVRGLRVIEGVTDPAQGDFSVAGSADFELGVEKRGLRLDSSYGRFNSFRELLLYAPEGTAKDSFAAVSFRKTQGFGQNRASTTGSAMGQLAFGHERLKLTLSSALHASRAQTANVVRRDDVEQGVVGFYGVYPLATTEAQGAFAARAQLSAKLRYLGESGQNAELQLGYVLTDFRLLANYTGFTEVSQIEPSWAGRGDLTEQLNQARMLFMRGRYRTAAMRLVASSELRLEAGFSGRMDQIAQRQNLVEAPENTTWDKRVDASILAVDVGAYVDADLSLTRFARLKGGLRADMLAYGVEDALANFIPSFRADSHLPGYRRSAAGLAMGPRAALELLPTSQLTWSCAYGEGYRSPQARLLDDGEPAPFAKVRSGDTGLRFMFGPDRQSSVRGSAFYTHLTNDVAFDAREARPSPIGPTTRVGGVLYADLRVLSWLTATASVTYVRATLDAPPPKTLENPSPAYESGQRLPYVPSWVGRFDGRAEQHLGSLRGHALLGHVAAGLTVWSRRTLPFGESTPAVALLDASAGAKAGNVRVDLSLMNLLGARYAASEVVTASNFDPSGVPSRLPARHLTAGAPRTYLVTLGVDL
jgi:iron complex outermembrane receptor protein